VSAQWLPAVVMVPLVGGVLSPAIGYKRDRLAGWWALAIVTVTSAISAGLILRVAGSGPFVYEMGGWSPPWGIELRFDEFSASIGMMCLIAWLAVLFSQRYVTKAIPEGRIPYYYALLLLNLCGMIGFAVTGDLFNLFVFMEILSLSSYAMVAIGSEGVAETAAFRYLLMGAVSSLAVLFAIGLLYALTGTLNMADMGARLGDVSATLPASVALAALALGFSVKAALFPLHVWLPEAHSIAPSPVSAILSGLVVKIGVLGLLRVYQIYYQAPALDVTGLNQMLTWLGAISIAMGAFFAMTQEDIKAMLAYSTISNIGYIFMGLGLSSTFGLIGGVVHVFNHALIKATLFLGAGAIIYRTGLRNLSDLKGVGKTMPVTSAAIAIGAVSIVGLPPTAGFICKWYIALGAMEANQPVLAAVLLFGALLIFIYYIRMVNAFYFQEPVHASVIEAHEAPASMLAPVLVLAALCLIMGVFARIPLSFIEPAVLQLLAGPAGG
jgi:multicomponent Na+:H+ antiporter subunit D